MENGDKVLLLVTAPLSAPDSNFTIDLSGNNLTSGKDTILHAYPLPRKTVSDRHCLRGNVLSPDLQRFRARESGIDMRNRWWVMLACLLRVLLLLPECELHLLRR